MRSSGWPRLALTALGLLWGACLIGIALHAGKASPVMARVAPGQPSVTAPQAQPSAIAAKPPTSAPPQGRALRAGQIVRQVNTGGRKLIALTFDDGPWPNTSDEVLSLLHEFNARATFFWVGQALALHPEIAARILAAGHAVGNHTWHHLYKALSPAQAALELDSVANLVQGRFAQPLHLFRPPGGVLHNGLVGAARREGYTTVLWSVSSADTDPRASAAAFAENVIRGAKPGAIVLMHDGGGNRSRTVKALPLILAALQAQGYRFVTVPELLALGDT